ncbi:hypothetical protein [Haloferula sp. BvORR071]|uniref:hypothetical protein n=1 Tax=Haloferula sp. BvORR071 TaxID=1396141 RepID=UPI00055074B7|nr:hypothetical protein [Haloferula sp. BvORR071]
MPFLAGCDRLKAVAKASSSKADSAPAVTAPAAPALAAPAEPAEPPVLPPVGPESSPHFNRVAGKLDIGGKMLHFEDHEGEREMLIELVKAFLNGMPVADRNKLKVDPAALVDASGMAQAAASGRSLKRDGDAYLLRQYQYLPAGRTGFSTLLGKEPIKFRTPTMIPAATDLVIETRLDATALPEVLTAIAKACGQEADIKQGMNEKLPVGGTLKDLLAKTDLQLLLGVDISSWKATPTSPQPVDFFVQIDGAGELLKLMLPELEKGLGKAKVQGSRRGWELPMKPLMQAKTQLLYDDAGTLTYTSRAEYLKYVETAAMKLGQWKEYQAATDHFPENGNLLVYASPQVAPAIGWMLRNSASSISSEGAPFLAYASKYLTAKPWSLCIASEQDGLTTLAEMPYAIEIGGALPYLAGSSVLFVGARAWKKGSDRAACIMNTRNVQQAVRSYQNMNSVKPGQPIPWDKIVGSKDSFLAKQPTCAEGTYTFSKTVPKQGALACTCSNPEHAPSNHQDW